MSPTYDYYLRGRQFFYQMRRKGLEFARQMFARAIVIDPGYARAYAGVADCCLFLYMWCEASEDNLREAVSASRRAVELDPQSVEAHASHGFRESLSKNYETASKEFETALRFHLRLLTATTDLRAVDRVIFIPSEFHDNSPEWHSLACAGSWLMRGSTTCLVIPRLPRRGWNRTFKC